MSAKKVERTVLLGTVHLDKSKVARKGDTVKVDETTAEELEAAGILGPAPSARGKAIAADDDGEGGGGSGQPGGGAL